MTETIESELRTALSHLYDPIYEPSEALCELLGCELHDGTLAVQSVIIQTIERLKPLADTPVSAQTKQAYDLLQNRFVLGLTLEETAERLHMSYSSTWRAQRGAIHLLTRLLWEQLQQTGETSDEAREGATEGVNDQSTPVQAPEWRSQVQLELAALQSHAPGTVANVAETIRSVLSSESVLVAKRGVLAEIGFIQPGLVAAVHPSVLRQILIAAIGRALDHLACKQIRVFARLEDGNVRITVTGPVLVEHELAVEDLTCDIITPENVSIQACLEETHLFLWVDLPSMGNVTVLVVDDNLDMVQFYRRATQGTSYRIVHTTEGENLFEVVQDAAPDIIVLDVMLPDSDGWDLLMRLREEPMMRTIPVIVCSVVKEEELALSLGADCYLMKPVHPAEFIQALDHAVSRVP